MRTKRITFFFKLQSIANVRSLILLLTLAASANCNLLDNTIKGSLAGAPDGPAPTKDVSFEFSQVLVSANFITESGVVLVSLATKSTDGLSYYDPSALITFSFTGGISQGTLQNFVDFENGTYQIELHTTAVGSASQTLASINGIALTSSMPSVEVTASTLDFSGVSKQNADPSLRIFDEVTAPAWTLTGLCDADFGDVTIKGNGIDAPIVVPCEGSSFSQVINYDSTSPHFVAGFGALDIIISQNSNKFQTRTWLYKTDSSNPQTLVTTAIELQAMVVDDVNSFYILANSIDLAAEVSAANNWITIGTAATPFRGVFDGNGHTISNLDMNPVTINQGLFGRSVGAVISNLNMTNVDINSTSSGVGSVIGSCFAGKVSHISVDGSIIGNSNVGGIIGVNSGTLVNRISFAGSSSCSGYCGGLVGEMNGTDMNNSSSSADVDGSSFFVGGLVGNWINFGNLSNSYFTGSVTGAATGIGGLVGSFSGGTQVTNSYSVGNLSVSGLLSGPLVGSNFNPISNYYSSELNCSGCDNALGTDRSLSDLKLQTTYQNWDFQNIWTIAPDNNQGFPTLREF